MFVKTESKPTPLAVAQILESTLLSEEPYAGSLETLEGMLRNCPQGRELLEELYRPREDAPTLLELAKLLLALSEREPGDSYETALWAVRQQEDGRRAYEDLAGLAEDAGGSVDKPSRPVTLLQRHEEVDKLLASDDWEDPAHLVDPTHADVDEGAYRQWLSICVARQKRGEGDAERLRSAIRKIQTAGERESYVRSQLDRLESLEPVLRWLERANEILSRANAPGRTLRDGP